MNITITQAYSPYEVGAQQQYVCSACLECYWRTSIPAPGTDTAIPPLRLITLSKLWIRVPEINVDAHTQRFTQVHFSMRFERRWSIEAGTATSDSTGMRPPLARVDTAEYDRVQHAHQARNVV